MHQGRDTTRLQLEGGIGRPTGTFSLSYQRDGGRDMGRHGSDGDKRDGSRDRDKQGTFVDPFKGDKGKGGKDKSKDDKGK
ncbi:hypothetical protein GCM10023085_48620 [Actinomadura viridis]